MLPERIATPDVSAMSDEFRISSKHHEAFCNLCRVDTGVATSLIYPMTLVFPFFQRLLGTKQAPQPVFKVLAKYLRIRQYRPLHPDEQVSIVCRFEQTRIVTNGLELDISATVKHSRKPAWNAIETFFYRGRFGKETQSNTHRRFAPISNTDGIFRYPLPAGNGFRFARNCGDGNPLHYSRLYARLLGFEQDFAQPLMVLGQAVQHLGIKKHQQSLTFDVAFKGPCYYEHDIVLHTKADSRTQRFDVYSEGNPRTCMTGSLV